MTHPSLAQKISRKLGRLYWKITKQHWRSAGDEFSHVYKNKLWGGAADQAFYSGSGSHEAAIVTPYVKAIEALAGDLGGKLDAVDLGCGDFNVGRQVRHLFGKYTACDVVPELVQHNSQIYADRDVAFKVVDITRDSFPAGDIAFVRQVLQHLNNRQIDAVVPKLEKFRYVVLTEHLPIHADFVANRDKPTGDQIRLQQNPPSGVVLTQPPFHFRPRSERVLCEVPDFGGVIRTVLYELR